MGFWDVRLADLEALGEVFTDDEVRVLEEGGRVLHLHPLETPDVDTYDWCTYADGEVVVLPEIVEVSGLNDVVVNKWHLPGENPMAVAEVLDTTFSWRGNRKSWTDYPRYAGVVDTAHDIWTCRCDDLSAFVYWNCYPLLTQEDEALAEQIVGSAETFLERAYWYPVEWVCRLWYEGEYDPADVWMLVNHPERVDPVIREQLEDTFDYSFGNDGLHAMESDAQMFQDLLDARLISLTGDYADLDHGEENRTMPFPRMEDILEEKGHYAAADLWRRIQARRKASLARLPSPTNYRGYAENEVLD